MISTAVSKERHLTLHDEHLRAGARMGQFGDWVVPLYYKSIMEEHRAVRNAVGVFDISHMGILGVGGAKATEFLDGLVPRNISVVKPGKAAYSFLLNEDAGFLDDIIIYKHNPSNYFIIVNADNVEKDFEWISSHAPKDIKVENYSPSIGILAVQGPGSVKAVSAIYPQAKLQDVPYYGFLEVGSVILARTGYTGEDGFEILAPRTELKNIWNALMHQPGVSPVGFGARDTLRLEAGMPLYGQELSVNLDPLEAGLNWSIDFEKKNFLGLSRLKQKRTEGPTKRLVGFVMDERAIPRHGHEVKVDGETTGEVTSGGVSPTLNQNIGMAYVSSAYAQPGSKIHIIVRGQSYLAHIVPLPFYKRPKKI